MLLAIPDYFRSKSKTSKNIQKQGREKSSAHAHHCEQRQSTATHPNRLATWSGCPIPPSIRLTVLGYHVLTSCSTRIDISSSLMPTPLFNSNSCLPLQLYTRHNTPSQCSHLDSRICPPERIKPFLHLVGLVSWYLRVHVVDTLLQTGHVERWCSSEVWRCADPYTRVPVCCIGARDFLLFSCLLVLFLFESKKPSLTVTIDLTHHHTHIPTWMKAVEGMSGGAVIYTAFAVILVCFLGGITVFAMLGLVLDLLFCGAFIAIAVLARGGAKTCSGARSPLSNNRLRDCRFQKAVFAIAIAGA